jgi:hypothetical protein
MSHVTQTLVELKVILNYALNFQPRSNKTSFSLVVDVFRKNLAIERMIVEGCDILLDVNQVFVRQGTLIQVRKTPTKMAVKNFMPRGLGCARKEQGRHKRTTVGCEAGERGH